MKRNQEQRTHHHFMPLKRQHGFTIVELLIVIVVIAILATIVIVAYNGIQDRAHRVAVKSDVRQNASALMVSRAMATRYPESCDDVALRVSPGNSYDCRIVPDRSGFCLTVLHGDIAYYATSTNSTPREGTCDGWILVPGSAELGTSDFWIMKYEAKDVAGTATSVPNGLPWTYVSQPDAIARSSEACEGCHLTTEGEWMTLAANVLSVPGNWSGGTVGSGYVYNGHVGNSPAANLAASADDNDGLYGIEGNTGNGSTYNNRRTLTLTNGEIVWDLSGNVWEWTDATITGGQPGAESDPEDGYVWRDYTNYTGASPSWNGLPPISRPSDTLYSRAQGVGGIRSGSKVIATTGYLRGGDRGNGPQGGILALQLNYHLSDANSWAGFRVAR